MILVWLILFCLFIMIGRGWVGIWFINFSFRFLFTVVVFLFCFLEWKGFFFIEERAVRIYDVTCRIFVIKFGLEMVFFGFMFCFSLRFFYLLIFYFSWFYLFCYGFYVLVVGRFRRFLLGALRFLVWGELFLGYVFFFDFFIFS